ncbi:CheR family methyltransferase [Maridesulfovibrio hydrothermalis]|uniref:protein-glutamate O-methyltransferase n=1 Tax=Maridesulfovibrio hydrothermalis AM13 = DSM 14728 TaxID=1121451 RepID=L0RCP7_9BACT|nr:CheR family methyltransferase [Maridesulfovibrio hydrothermalis]CCO24558.1 MCP methyltransferase, CheR-type [Maridesulfovibrio hydrothermalis AM13 = DSM 14728]
MVKLFSGRGFSGSIKITPGEFIQLRNIIYELSGIFLQDNRRFLVENRFAPRLSELKLKSYTDYIRYLKHERKGKTEELNMLTELITTNETSFFRDAPQLKAFRLYTLKELIDAGNKSGKREIKIWSAGCSSGEEPYTLAIILHEALKDNLRKWRIRITANDISTNVLNMAKKGVYTKYALRTTPAPIIAKYFTEKDNDIYHVNPEVKRLVSFGKINLNQERSIKLVPKSHVVFCRNVIIYFDKEMKKKVIAGFYNNLVDDGHLYIGHSESLHLITNTFKSKQHVGAISYRKI